MSLVDATMKLLRDLRHGLESDVARSVCNTHPLSPAYRESLSVTLRARADQLWLDLCGVFVGLEAEAALRQAWSISPSSAVWTGLLYSAATRDSPSMRAEAKRLLALCPDLSVAGERILSRPAHAVESLGYWLLANEPGRLTPTPDLGFDTSLRPQWRLRFCLASAVARGESLVQLFRRAAAQPSVSDTYRRTEFLRALHAHRTKTGKTSRLAPTTIVLFDERQLRLLRSMTPYWSEFVSSSLTRSPDPIENLDALIARRAQLQSLFKQIESALDRRAFDEVNRRLADLPADPITDAVARAYFTLCEFIEGDDWAHPANEPEWGPWPQLTQSAHQRIGSWRQRALPAVWAMTPSEVQRAILRKDLPPVGKRRGFYIQDLVAIRRSWSEAEQLELIRGGFTSLIEAQSPVWEQLSIAELASALSSFRPSAVEQLAKRLKALPDARPWLAAMAEADPEEFRARAERCLRVPGGQSAQRNVWSDFCASAVGTPEWQAVRGEAMREVVLISQAIALRARNRVPVDAIAQREAVARALHEPTQCPRQVMALCIRWIALDPEALPTLVRLAPKELVEKLLRNRLSPPHLRQKIAAIYAAIYPRFSLPRRIHDDLRQVPLL
jgi:hypothetical protein